jgi:uncharacterized protein YjbJ (UPF0337 family)
MNADQLEGKWKQLKGSVKEKWGKLTDDDLDVIAGKRDKLIGRLQERYGITKEEAERQADLWQTTAEVAREKSFTQRT